MKEKILIISATGKTGFQTSINLLKENHPVRVLVRSRNDNVLQLEKLGAEVIIGDFTNYKHLMIALTDIQRVYYCHPFIPNLLENTKTFIRAAEESKVETVVNLGQWLAEFDEQKSIQTNHIKGAYSAFEKSKLNSIQLIPGFFADNTFFVLEFAVQLGLMPLPFGNGKNPAISNEDLGLVIAALLKNPTHYYGQKLRPTGSKSLSTTEMADIFSKVVGRKVRYINIPEWMFVKAAFAFAEELGMNNFTISQVRHYMKEYQLNRFDVGGATDVVKSLTGKEPDDFETIVRRYVDNSPYGKRSFSGWISAMKKFMAIPLTKTLSIKELEKLNR